MAEGTDASRRMNCSRGWIPTGVVYDASDCRCAVPTGERLIAWVPLATHPARLELATVPVRSSPAVEALGAEVRGASLRLPALPPSCS